MSEERTFTAVDNNGVDRSDELNAFKHRIRLGQVTDERYSILLLLQLYVMEKQGTQDPARVIMEIEALERDGASNQMKPPTQFTRERELSGLWHQHYLPDGISTFALNLKNAMNTYGIPYFEQKMREAEIAGETRYVSEDDIGHIVNDLVNGNWARRISDKKLTGEWIIFAKHNNINYYLCLGNHKSDKSIIREQIEKCCLCEFPFLETSIPRILTSSS